MMLLLFFAFSAMVVFVESFSPMLTGRLSLSRLQMSSALNNNNNKNSTYEMVPKNMLARAAKLRQELESLQSSKDALPTESMSLFASDTKPKLQEEQVLSTLPAPLKTVGVSDTDDDLQWSINSLIDRPRPLVEQVALITVNALVRTEANTYPIVEASPVPVPGPISDVIQQRTMIADNFVAGNSGVRKVAIQIDLFAEIYSLLQQLLALDQQPSSSRPPFVDPKPYTSDRFAEKANSWQRLSIKTSTQMFSASVRATFTNFIDDTLVRYQQTPSTLNDITDINRPGNRSSTAGWIRFLPFQSPSAEDTVGTSASGVYMKNLSPQDTEILDYLLLEQVSR